MALILLLTALCCSQCITLVTAFHGATLTRTNPRITSLLHSTTTARPPTEHTQIIHDAGEERTLPNALESSATSSVLIPQQQPTEDSVETSTVLADVPSPDVLALWRRRLITHEDPLSVHKWASIVYTVSSIAILGTGGVRLLSDFMFPAAEGEALFATIPMALAPWVAAFSGSNLIMCLASVRMAFIHRQGDLPSRNAFLGTAASSLFSGFLFVFFSPFAPEFLNTELGNHACFALLVLLNIYFVMDTLVQVPELLEGRRDRKEDGGGAMATNQFVQDAFGYILPIAWGLPTVVATGYQVSYLHDRAWFLEYCNLIQQGTGLPFYAEVCYLQVVASLAASYGALFVTLRDKKLISKNQELVGISAFSVPAMIFTIYVTAIFYQQFGLLPTS